MGGANLEVFKFGFYMFFPIYIMFKFGDPDWYDSYVQPYKEKLWPDYESTHKPPKTHADLQIELARMKAQRLAKRNNQSQAASAQNLDMGGSLENAGPSGVISELGHRGVNPDWTAKDQRWV